MSKMYITQLAAPPPPPPHYQNSGSAPGTHLYQLVSSLLIERLLVVIHSFRDGKAESPGNYGTETPLNSMVNWNPSLGSYDVTPFPNSSPVSDVSPHTPSGFPVSGVTPLPSSSSVSASTSLANTRQVFSAVMEFLTLPLA